MGTNAIPRVVYHYTSMDALLGIVKGSIWATNIRYLNDVSEYDHFLRLVRKRLPQLTKSHGLGHTNLVARIVSQRKAYLTSYMDLPFVASFSQERDSLAHWRSYCSQGNGVCIGFRTASIKDAYLEKAKKEVWLTGFWPVTYLGTDDLKVLDGMINKDLSHSIRLIKKMESAQGAIASDRDKVGLVRAEFEMRAGRTKHKSFMHEREYRLIALLFVQKELKELVSFRASRSTLFRISTCAYRVRRLLQWHEPHRFSSLTASPLGPRHIQHSQGMLS